MFLFQVNLQLSHHSLGTQFTSDGSHGYIGKGKGYSRCIQHSRRRFCSTKHGSKFEAVGIDTVISRPIIGMCSLWLHPCGHRIFVVTVRVNAIMRKLDTYVTIISLHTKQYANYIFMVLQLYILHFVSSFDQVTTDYLK